MSILTKCFDFNRADEVKDAGIYPYFRAVEESEGPVVMMEGRRVVMAGSNNYLGLTTHPRVTEAAIKAIEKYGTSCSGSRFLTGTIDLHIELEHKLARFMGKEAALLFSTGYQTGQGVIATLIGSGEHIISDRDNHASIVAGNMLAAAATMGRAKVHRFKHNNMDDLARVLEKLPPDEGKLIVADGVFSGMGTVVDLPNLVKVAQAYNANILLDDAHALGVIGDGGRGTASDFGLTKQVDMVMCTFSKSLASLGGFVAADERVINFLKHHSSALIFSASPTPSSVAAASAALDIMIEQPHLPQKLVQNAEHVRKGLRAAGFNVPDGRTAIVPVIIGDDIITFKMWKSLFDAGIFVNAFISPATPPGMQMLRTSYMATHETEHLDFIVHTLTKIGKQLNII